MRHNWSPALYLVADADVVGDPERLRRIAVDAVQGGVTVVQLRWKSGSGRAFTDLARAMHFDIAGSGVPLIVNDRVDVALATGADGVHLGQSDLYPADARRLLGDEAIIGLSVENADQVREAEAFDVDYLAISPVFATPTKTDTGRPWGIEGVRAVRSASRHKLVAIGGLNASNAAAVIRAGADGIAVVTAICCAEDPRAAAAALGRLCTSPR